MVDSDLLSQLCEEIRWLRSELARLQRELNAAKK
jgi:hypothetical protein